MNNLHFYEISKNLMCYNLIGLRESVLKRLNQREVPDYRYWEEINFLGLEQFPIHNEKKFTN